MGESQVDRVQTVEQLDLVDAAIASHEYRDQLRFLGVDGLVDDGLDHARRVLREELTELIHGLDVGRRFAPHGSGVAAVGRGRNHAVGLLDVGAVVRGFAEQKLVFTRFRRHHEFL